MATRAATKADMGAISMNEQVAGELAKNATYLASQNVKPGLVSGTLDTGAEPVTRGEEKQAVAAAKKMVKQAQKAAKAGAEPPKDAPVIEGQKHTGKRADYEKHRRETIAQQEAAGTSVDAALAKLMGKEPDQGPPAEAPAEDDRDDVPESTPDDGEESDDSEADDAGLEADEDEYEKATAILRLDGWKSKALAKLSQQEVLELAATRQKIRAGVEERLNELATLKKTAAAGQEKPRTDATAQPATGVSSFDVKKATTRIREEWDERTGDAIGEALSGVATWVQSLIAEETAKLQPLFAHVNHLTEAGARARLADVYPQVRKDKDWEGVKKQLLKLNPVAFDHDIDAMFAEAAESKFGRPTKSNGVPKERVLAARARGQADVSSRTKDATPVTSDNKIDLVYAALARGDRAEAERIGRQ